MSKVRDQASFKILRFRSYLQVRTPALPRYGFEPGGPLRQSASGSDYGVAPFRANTNVTSHDCELTFES